MSTRPDDENHHDGPACGPLPMSAFSGKKLLLVMLLLCITFLGELIGGWVSGSLSLISDSIHVLGDTFALGLAFAAITIANRALPTEKMTYGYGRLEVMSAILNGGTLVAASAMILVQSINRFQNLQEIQVFLALPIAIVGLLVNGVSALILRAGKVHLHDLNVRGAYLHILADFGASVAVIVGLLAIHFWDLRFIDPLVAMGISVSLLIGAIRVLKEGAGILLQQSPHDTEKLAEIVRSVDHVVDIPDFHLWQVCSHMVIGTAHIVTDVERLEETEEIANQIQKLLEEKFQVKHLTLQFESPDMGQHHTHKMRHEERTSR